MNHMSSWHWVQLANDTFWVSLLQREIKMRADVFVEEKIYLELSGEEGRAHLVVLIAKVGGWWSEETATFLAASANPTIAAYVHRCAVLTCSAISPVGAEMVLGK